MATSFQPVTESPDLAHAKFLRSIVVDKLQKGARWSSSKWAEEFRLLKKTVHEDKVAAALVWFDANCQLPNLPPIESATSFRRHFNWLCQCMSKDKRKKVEISADAQDVTQRLLKLTWTKVTNAEVATAVQLSLEAYDSFFQIVLSLVKTRKQRTTPHKSDWYLLFLESFVNGYLVDSRHFVERWMTSIHQGFDRWEGWNGDLMAQVFSFQHQRFQRVARSWAKLQGFLDSDWDSFVQDVTNAS